MKRANSNKKSHVPGDFKRLKAKVGKKAPQRLNTTETKFKTASVQVKSQNVTNEPNSSKISTLVSSKGKHFSQLMATLNHPAANARSSALQGMKDAINNTPDNIIPQHLSLIIPSLSKCFVDEDSGIRKVTISILFQNVAPRISSCGMAGSMRPFLYLILAYIGSALHSLDQDVRYDGCQALEALCDNYSYLFKEEGGLIEKLESTIPAFTILLDDVSSGLASMSRRGVGSLTMAEKDQKKSNNRKKQTKASSRGNGVLKSYLAVMRTTTSFRNGCDVLDEEPDSSRIDSKRTEDSDEIARLFQKSLLPSMSKPDLEFVRGGRCSNGIVWKRDNTRHAPVNTIDNFRHFYVGSDLSNLAAVTASSIDVKIQLALFTKLRDRFIEISQLGQPADIGIYLGPSHAQECSFVIGALHLLWTGYIIGALTKPEKVPNKDTTKMHHTANSALNLLLECFPFKDTNGSSNNHHIYDSLNASMCMALSEIGSILDIITNNQSTTIEESRWVNAIFSYVSPQLEGSIEDDNDSSSTTRVTLVKVVERLLLSTGKSHQSRCLLSGKRYMDLLYRFRAAYFPSKTFNSSLSKSAEGRRAAALLVSLINQYLADDNGSKSKILWANLLEMATLLPIYLIKWRGCYPKDTTLVLGTLLAISRNCKPAKVASVENSSSDDSCEIFCSALRSSMDSLFVTSKKKKNVGLSGNASKISVFEEFSYAGQTLLLSIIGVLRFPSDNLMASLAHICARQRNTTHTAHKEAIIDYIMIVTKSINRTMSLQQYLSFLINSTGVNVAGCASSALDRDTKEIDSSAFEFIFSYDAAVSRTCRYMLLTKSNSIANSFRPIMQSWLDTEGNEGKAIRLVKSRAAISILCCQALHYERTDFEAKCTVFDQSDLRDCLGRAIYNIFLSISTTQENVADHHVTFDDAQRKFVTPVLVSHKKCNDFGSSETS